MFSCTVGVDLFPCCVDIQGIVSTHILHEKRARMSATISCCADSFPKGLAWPDTRQRILPTWRTGPIHCRERYWATGLRMNCLTRSWIASMPSDTRPVRIVPCQNYCNLLLQFAIEIISLNNCQKKPDFIRNQAFGSC